MPKHLLKKEFKFEDQTITELDLDLDSLTGRDISQVKRAWAVEGNFSPMPSTDIDFCAMLAAKASKQPIELIQAMPAKEYTAVAQVVSNFLNE
jgi:hypothetical protein